MTLFHKIEEAVVVLRARGVYRQVDAYQREGKVYARWGSGFIGLRWGIDGMGTTLSHVSVDATDGLKVIGDSFGPVMLRVDEEKRSKVRAV